MTDQNNITVPNLVKKHPFRQWNKWAVPNSVLTLEGYSRAGDKTFFFVPQIKLCLDAALAEGHLGDYVLVTHTHNDHIADIEYLASRDGVQIYLPEASVGYLEQYITARRCLNHSAPYNAELRGNHSIHGVKEGDTFYIGKGNRYEVKVVNCHHRIACVGYALAERKQRLKPEYEKLKQEKMAEGKMKEFGQIIAQKKREAKQKGESVEDTFYEPLFVFMGDTHASVFAEAEWIFDYPTIITECTFIDKKNEAFADERSHILWDHLRPYVAKHSNCQFILTHFSLRHSDKEIIGFFEKEMKEHNLQNILLWASQETLLPSQHQAQG